MEIPGKLILVGTIGCALAGAAIERQFNSRETVKTVNVDHDVIKYKVITQTHEVDKPDGSKVIDSTVSDNTEEQKKIVDTIVDKKASTQPQFLAAASIGLNTNKVKIYSISLDRRLLGPATLGAYVSTDSEAGLRVGIEF